MQFRFALLLLLLVYTFNRIATIKKVYKLKNKLTNRVRDDR
jgi:hypothetical protein